VALHLAIARATHNPVLADLFASFAAVLRGTIADVMRDPVSREDTSATHGALVQAIADGDAPAAVEATRQLLEADARALRVPRRP
jgi:GntR family transcriptional repressor for pyruvate dehydrogenase complex